jgi:hypothetical protein
MLKNKFTMSFLLLVITLAAKSQSKAPLHDFANFVSKRYRLPDELKYNCEWVAGTHSRLPATQENYFCASKYILCSDTHEQQSPAKIIAVRSQFMLLHSVTVFLSRFTSLSWAVLNMMSFRG